MGVGSWAVISKSALAPGLLHLLDPGPVVVDQRRPRLHRGDLVAQLLIRLLGAQSLRSQRGQAASGDTERLLGIGVGEGEQAQHADRILGREARSRRDLQAGGTGFGGDGVGRDLAELARQPRLDVRCVKSVATTDEHEVLLARLDHLRPAVEELRVELVGDQLVTVDAAGGVAPFGERVCRVEELLLQAWCGGRARITERPQVDGLADDAAT